jgi:hypothetical protein
MYLLDNTTPPPSGDICQCYQKGKILREDTEKGGKFEQRRKEERGKMLGKFKLRIK